MERKYSLEWEEIATSSTPRVGSLEGESIVHLRDCAEALVEAARNCDDVATVASAIRVALCAAEESVFLISRFSDEQTAAVIERLAGARMNVRLGLAAKRVPTIAAALGLEA